MARSVFSGFFIASLCLIIQESYGAEPIPTFGSPRSSTSDQSRLNVLPRYGRDPKIGRFRVDAVCELMANISSTTQSQRDTQKNSCNGCFNTSSDNTVFESASNIPAYRRCVERHLGSRYKPCNTYLEAAAKETNNNAYKLRLNMAVLCISYHIKQDVQEECLTRIRGLPDNGDTMSRAMTCNRELLGFGHIPAISPTFGGGVGFLSDSELA